MEEAMLFYIEQSYKELKDNKDVADNNIKIYLNRIEKLISEYRHISIFTVPRQKVLFVTFELLVPMGLFFIALILFLYEYKTINQ